MRTSAHTLSHTCIHYVHTFALTRSNTQPEAEDLRLHSGTWSQSHLGPQILLCSPQSVLILCHTESCRAPPCLPYLPTCVPPNSCSSLLFPFHGLKGFSASSALGYVCTVSLNGYRESLGRQRRMKEVTHLIEVKLSPACETKEEGLEEDIVEGGWGLLWSTTRRWSSYKPQTCNCIIRNLHTLCLQLACFANLPLIFPLSRQNRFWAIKWHFAFSHRWSVITRTHKHCDTALQ